MNKNQNILTSLACTFVVFLFNFFVPSQLNGFPKNGFNFNLYNLYQSSNAETIFNVRYNNPVFRSRPFTLEIQKFLNESLDVPFQLSFNIINFLFLFLLFYSLSKFDFRIKKHEPKELKIIFLVSLPILFAFLGSLGTYDDLPQYAFLYLFLIYLFSEKHLLSILFFILACIVRETSLIFYLIILPFLIFEVRVNKVFKLFLWVLPIIVYYFFLRLYLDNELINSSKDFLVNRRFYAWQSNFLSISKFRESTTILLLMLFPYLYLLYRKFKNETSTSTKKWCLISGIFILANAFIVSVSGLISEMRLLFIPLLFVLPFLQHEIKNSFYKIWSKLNKGLSYKAIFISGVISFLWYSPKSVGTGYFFKIYIFIFFWFFFELISNNKKKDTNIIA